MVDRMRKIDLRTVTMDVPPQDVITKDNVSLKVNAVIYFRVVDPDKAVVQVEHYLFATSQLAQTTLRSVLGQHELDQLLAERERERRAKVIHADGEFQAAARLGDASDIIGSHPPALHLRYLQALTEIAAEKNSTTIFPVPMDLLDAFIKKVKS